MKPPRCSLISAAASRLCSTRNCCTSCASSHPSSLAPGCASSCLCSICAATLVQSPCGTCRRSRDVLVHPVSVHRGARDGAPPLRRDAARLATPPGRSPSSHWTMCCAAGSSRLRRTWSHPMSCRESRDGAPPSRRDAARLATPPGRSPSSHWTMCCAAGSSRLRRTWSCPMSCAGSLMESPCRQWTCRGSRDVLAQPVSVHRGARDVGTARPRRGERLRRAYSRSSRVPRLLLFRALPAHATPRRRRSALQA